MVGEVPRPADLDLAKVSIFVLLSYTKKIETLLIKSVIDPVNELTKTLGNISGGNFSTKVDINSNNEIGMLYHP